jgi:hypothetical protein
MGISEFESCGVGIQAAKVAKKATEINWKSMGMYVYNLLFSTNGRVCSDVRV